MIRGWSLLLLFFTSLSWSQNWQPTWEVTQEIAKKEHQSILLVFSGSDWCIPCIRLENEVWESSAFKTYAENHLVLYRADFPKRKKNRLSKSLQQTHDHLAELYNKNGFFPWVVVLNEALEFKGALSYKNEQSIDYIPLIEQLVNE